MIRETELCMLFVICPNQIMHILAKVNFKLINFNLKLLNAVCFKETICTNNYIYLRTLTEIISNGQFVKRISNILMHIRFYLITKGNIKYKSIEI